MPPRELLRLIFLVSCSLGLSPDAFGQNLSVGVIVGTGLSEDFRTLRQPVILPGQPIGYRLEYSNSRSLIAGGMVEWSLPGPLSVEVDGLYRRLRGINPSGNFTTVTWEFPILAKYRFDVAGARAFVETGPSLRTTGNLNSANPSHFGLTAGLGIEGRIKGLNIAPRVRYTRWAADKVNNQFESESLRNQLELLVGISRSSISNWRPLGRRISLGVLLGTNLTSDFRSITRTRTDESGQFASSFVRFPGPKSLIAGPALEIDLTERLSIEVSALHRPEKQASLSTFADGTSFRIDSATPTWQFPVLAKYRFPAGRVTPFVEAGPSFRLTQVLLTDASPYGVTGGAGIEGRLRDLTIAPRVRHTRWARNSRSDDEFAIRNKTDFLVGLSF